jgi:hypothetical protein
VARKGAKRPIFEGNMPPKKMYPQYWRRYRRHNRNPVNRIPVMAPILAPLLGVHFWGEYISLKNGTFCPFSATIQALSRTRAYLLRGNERKLLCMGRTFTVARTDLLHNCPKHVVCQLGIESGSCKS